MEFLTLVLYDDMTIMREYELSRESSFVAERMDDVAKFDWKPESQSLYTFTRMSVNEALSLQHMSRSQIMNEYEISDYLARKYKALSKLLQKVCELEMYGMYNMYAHNKFVPYDLYHKYMKTACANVESPYWYTRFKNMLHSKCAL